MTVRPRSFLILLVILIAAVAIWAWTFWADLRSSGLPQRDGAALVTGLEAPVDIRYDAWGVPHLQAGSRRDLAAAIGWAHANDRMGQLELIRRAAAGRLAEIFGPDLLEMDRKMRLHRLDTTAQRLVEAAGEESLTWLRGYADGVNAWLGAHADDLPPLFHLSGHQPEPWRPEDSMAVPLLMGLQLSFAFGPADENRFLALRGLGAVKFSELWPAAEIPDAIRELLRKEEGSPVIEMGASPQETAGGSNNWAVAAGRTATGAPLFANDPHLELRLPSIWYQLHLRCPDFEAAGMSLVGVPGVVIGHNRDLAWGFTNLMLDDHDLLFEQLDDSGQQVRRGAGWEPIQRQSVFIPVKGEEPDELELMSTSRGPLLPADEDRGLPPRTVLWTAYFAGDVLAAFLGLGQAATLEEARAAASHFICPAQNLVVVHRDGGLMHTVLGRLPARRRGDGRLPGPGWDPSFGWDGLQPPEAHFLVRDPETGLIVTANHDVRPPDWQGKLSADFDTPFRAQRIRQRLDERSDWTAEELAGVQNDITDLYALDLIDKLGQPAVRGDAALALQALHAWDGVRRADGEALLFQRFERELAELLFRDEEEDAEVPKMSFFFRRPQLRRALDGQLSAAWWDDLDTAPVEDRAAGLQLALERAWQAVTAEHGVESSSWDFGAHHELPLENQLGAVPLLGHWFNRGPYRLPGSATTVAAFGGTRTETGVVVTYGPSFRFVADPADWDRSRVVLPGGQGGHPSDPHYDDQIPLYLDGETRLMPWSEAAIAHATRSSLRLEP